LFVLAAIAAGFAGWRAVRRTRFFLHVFQLETYKLDRYRRWLGDHGSAILRGSHIAGGLLLSTAVGLLNVAPAAWVVAGLLPLWALAFVSSKRYRSTREKKPLAFTARMTRLAIATGVLAGLPVLAGAALGWSVGSPSGFLAFLLGFLLTDLGAPLWVALGALLMQPVETTIQNGFKRQARRRLRSRPNLTVVGITGSYGKTSTKFVLAELLRQKYSVLATPGSYNTPMGICLVVNERLKPEHQILVLEMGIRYRGDIEELCAIAPPDLSIVTTVGMAHLETMGSVETIAQEKGDILQYMKTGGPAVLNIDNEHVARMTKRATGPVHRVSVEGADGADVTARDIHYDTEGTRFRVETASGESAEFRTKLLGIHNVLNVLLAVAAGRELDLRLRQMAHAVRRVEPIEHRLALRSDNGITIIDDAFNSNPIGARNAVEILGQMNGERRVIVTPGMVELGERQDAENRTLGQHIAHHGIDLAVLIGDEQTAAIQEGLRDANMPAERVRVFDSLFDAQDFLKTYLTTGDVVLYENDLPDQYDS
jgi:UDP-N-acetylmuramoyl-tripeptide--D-alanyl-D-alanine ligase